MVRCRYGVFLLAYNTIIILTPCGTEIFSLQTYCTRRYRTLREGLKGAHNEGAGINRMAAEDALRRVSMYV
jgi:hypothetical protein